MHLRALQIFSILSILLILIAIPRGFDFSDEGLYVLVAVPSQVHTKSVLVYDLFFKLFHALTGLEWGIVGLRWLRLLGTLMAAFALVGFVKLRINPDLKTQELFWYILLGVLTSYAFLPPTLSYNSLVLFAACFWLYGMERDTQIWLAIAGLFLALLAYVKLPVALGLVMLSIIWKHKKIPRLGWLLGLMGAFLLFFESLFHFLFSDSLTQRALLFLAESNSRESYQLASLMKSTGVGVFWVFLVGTPFYCSSKISDLYPFLKKVLLGLGVIVLIFSLWVTHITEEWNHVVLLISGACFAYALGRKPLNSWASSKKGMILMLFGLPFILHLGSNVYWLRLGIYFWVFWWVCIPIFYPKSFRISSLVVGPLTFLLVGWGIWVSPFEQEPLWNANHVWNYGGGKRILLNSKQIELLEELKQIKEKVRGNVAASAYRNPGMAYLVGISNWQKSGFWEKNELNSIIDQEGIPPAIIYFELDSLSEGLKSKYQSQSFGNYQGNSIQFLWK